MNSILKAFIRAKRRMKWYDLIDVFDRVRVGDDVVVYDPHCTLQMNYVQADIETAEKYRNMEITPTTQDGHYKGKVIVIEGGVAKTFRIRTEDGKTRFFYKPKGMGEISIRFLSKESL